MSSHGSWKWPPIVREERMNERSSSIARTDGEKRASESYSSKSTALPVAIRTETVSIFTVLPSADSHPTAAVLADDDL